MKVIGLTGPTGCGKSTVTRIWGLPVVDADKIAHEILTFESVQQSLVAAFGQSVVQDGTVNRKELARLAFATKEQTAKLNAITHPAILAEMQQQMRNLSDSGAAFCVIDAPLLLEAGVDAYCDTTVALTAPKEVRLARIMQRDGITREQAKARMSAQPEDDFYKSRCAHILVNDGDLTQLQQVAKQLLLKIGE